MKRTAALSSALLVTLCTIGCQGTQIPLLEQERELPHELPQPEPSEFEPAAGSLWRGDASRRFLSFENRAKQIGDLVTVVISERARAENTATTDLNRTSEFSATIDSDIQLQTLVTRPVRNLLSFLGFINDRAERDPRAELNVVEATTDTKYEGDGTTERNSNFTTTIACVVSEITPSGLLRVSGERHLRINFETQIIRFDGYVRPEDIQIDNTIPSSLVANADIEFGGQGVVNDKQKVPLFTRVFEYLLPF